MTDSVRRSRTRLLAASDEVRRQLERDLHDGAQQDLVAVQFRTVMARGAADPNGVERELDAIDRHTGAALDELRALAQGVYPSVLRDLGVGAALHALAKRSSLPVQVSDMGINAALINMRDRIAAVGGELAIHSALGRGTSYTHDPRPRTRHADAPTPDRRV